MYGRPASTAPVPQAGPGAADLRPLGMGEMLDVAIKLVIKNWRTLLKLVAIVVVPVQLLAALIQASAGTADSVFPAFNNAPASPEDLAVNGAALGAFIVGMLIVTLLTLVAQQLATGGSLKAISDAYLGHTPDWKQSIAFVKPRLGSLIWIAFLTAILTGLAMIALIVPGVYLWAAFSLATPVLVIESTRGWAALKRSKELVKGRWWNVFGVLLVGTIVTAVVSSLFGALGIAGSASSNPIVQFLGLAIQNVASGLIVTPFMAAVVAVLYFDQRVRKEGFDLAILAQHMGEPEPPAL